MKCFVFGDNREISQNYKKIPIDTNFYWDGTNNYEYKVWSEHKPHQNDPAYCR